MATTGRVSAATGFTLFRDAAQQGILEFVRDASSEGTGFHNYHGTTGLSRIPRQNRGLSERLRLLCGASDAFTRFTRNVDQFRSFFVVVGMSASDAQELSWGLLFVCFVRDVFVRERNIIIRAGRVWAGTRFTLFRGAGAGYRNLCGTRLCGHGNSHLSSDYGIIPNPA